MSYNYYQNHWASSEEKATVSNVSNYVTVNHYRDLITTLER